MPPLENSQNADYIHRRKSYTDNQGQNLKAGADSVLCFFFFLFFFFFSTNR